VCRVGKKKNIYVICDQYIMLYSIISERRRPSCDWPCLAVASAKIAVLIRTAARGRAAVLPLPGESRRERAEREGQLEGQLASPSIEFTCLTLLLSWLLVYGYGRGVGVSSGGRRVSVLEF